MNKNIISVKDLYIGGKMIAFIKGNRSVNSKNISRKKKSFEKFGMNLVPLMYVDGQKAVNDGCTLVHPITKEDIPDEEASKYVAIVEGQHRYTAAEEKGLGICYLGTTTYNPQMIIEALELPELVFPITTVTVGWPAETPAQVDRLPLEAIVHEETYHDYTPEDIDRLYAYKESLPENKQFIAENNKETLAQVFTDVRYTKKDSEAMSENLWKVMKQQGF